MARSGKFVSAVTTLARLGTGLSFAVLIGTVGYLSPEQARGEPADQRSDIFALGAVLYEMLTGERAFKGTSPAELLSSVLRDEPPALSEKDPRIPNALDRIVHHCLEKNREQRFQSARDLAFHLEGLGGASTTQRAPELPTLQASRWRRPTTAPVVPRLT